MIKAVALWIVIFNPTAECIKEDATKNITTVVEIGQTKPVQIRVRGKAPVRQMKLVHTDIVKGKAKLPEFAKNACYEVYTMRLRTSKLKTQWDPIAEKAKRAKAVKAAKKKTSRKGR